MDSVPVCFIEEVLSHFSRSFIQNALNLPGLYGDLAEGLLNRNYTFHFDVWLHFWFVGTDPWNSDPDAVPILNTDFNVEGRANHCGKICLAIHEPVAQELTFNRTFTKGLFSRANYANVISLRIYSREVSSDVAEIIGRLRITDLELIDSSQTWAWAFMEKLIEKKCLRKLDVCPRHVHLEKKHVDQLRRLLLQSQFCELKICVNLDCRVPVVAKIYETVRLHRDQMYKKKLLLSDKECRNAIGEHNCQEVGALEQLKKASKSWTEVKELFTQYRQFVF
ncbi:hypothetical protein QR680_011304 [Steinernema hermaphroditum]|uniref:Uncharacterized protein n=1 Tax=Steinernema hermaphroditum TaxID=289476 RepID=A0AA39IT13_9BILA|nr:hypothetical protein QR680_011304 [Steinernema hermaphroditum]